MERIICECSLITHRYNLLAKYSYYGKMPLRIPRLFGSCLQRTRDWRIMNSKNKGAVGERELSTILSTFGFSTRRGQQYCGANGDADVVGLPGIHIECKRVERLNIYEAMEQSVKDARKGETPVVMFRRNRKRWLVAMDLNDWMSMYIAAQLYADEKGGNNGTR